LQLRKSPPGEGGSSQTVGEGRGRAFIHHPSSALTGTFPPQGEEFPSLLKTVDSATPGKPFVQNDTGVR